VIIVYPIIRPEGQTRSAAWKTQWRMHVKATFCIPWPIHSCITFWLSRMRHVSWREQRRYYRSKKNSQFISTIGFLFHVSLESNILEWQRRECSYNNDEQSAILVATDNKCNATIHCQEQQQPHQHAAQRPIINLPRLEIILNLKWELSLLKRKFLLVLLCNLIRRPLTWSAHLVWSAMSSILVGTIAKPGQYDNISACHCQGIVTAGS
jgi:hypothetical protein